MTAIATAQRIAGAGPHPAADQLRTAAIHAFEHSFAADCLVAGAVAGRRRPRLVMLPARPATAAPRENIP